MHVVLLTSDTDCDGTSYGAHRIKVPAELPLDDHEVVMAYAKATDQMSSYYDGVDELMSLPDFLLFAQLSQRHLSSFLSLGYTSHHQAPNWNPWVYDDTIGIPALDTRYED